MKTISNEFLTAVQDPARNVILLVEFEFVDPDAKGNTVRSETGNAAISRVSQLLDGERDNFLKLASFEQDYFQLDGSFLLPPETDQEATDAQVGWWSSEISTADGSFSAGTEPTLTFTWPAKISTAGLTLTFAQNEVPADFNVNIYDGVTLVKTVPITNNTEYRLWVEDTLENYDKLELQFLKTSNPYRRIRVIEVDFGHVFVFGDSDLVSASIVEQLDPANLVSPTNELTLEIINKDRKYSLSNPSGYYEALQQRQLFVCKWGVEVSPGNFEYVDGGRFYLSDWGVNSGLTAKFVGRDILDLLEQTRYIKGGVLTNATRSQTLEELAIDILTDANISASNYTLDPSLATISTSGYLDPQSHREALQTVAIAANCVLDADRDNHIHIMKLSDTETGEGIPQSQQWSVPKVILENIVNTIETNVYTYVDATAQSKLYDQQIDINGTVDVVLLYDSPSLDVTVDVTGGTLNNTTAFVNGAILNITAAGTVSITINGYLLQASSRIHKSVSASKKSTDPELAVTVKNNLITTDLMATDVNTYLLNYYTDRLIFDVDNRGNPALLTGDLITVTDDYGTAKTARITKQELSYNGVLRVRTSTRGSV